MKPLDKEIIKEAAENHDLIVTAEENVIQGGAGSACLEAIAEFGGAVPGFASRHSLTSLWNKETILPCLRNAAWITTVLERKY